MAKCALCGKKGLFLRVSSIGLCSSCQARFNFIVPRLNQVLQESQKIIRTSKSLDTKVSRCKTALSMLNRMQDFGEEKYDVVYAVTKNDNLDSMISLYQDMLNSLNSLLTDFEETILDILSKRASMSKRKLVETFITGMESQGREASELPYSIDKSVTDVLKRFELEGKITKEKIGNRYMYTLI